MTQSDVLALSVLARAACHRTPDPEGRKQIQSVLMEWNVGIDIQLYGGGRSLVWVGSPSLGRQAECHWHMKKTWLLESPWNYFSVQWDVKVVSSSIRSGASRVPKLATPPVDIPSRLYFRSGCREQDMDPDSLTSLLSMLRASLLLSTLFRKLLSMSLLQRADGFGTSGVLSWSEAELLFPITTI